MGSFSVWHWLIVLVIVVLVFGTGKLKNMGKDLGGAIKGFKEGMKEGDDDKARRPRSSSLSRRTRLTSKPRKRPRPTDRRPLGRTSLEDPSTTAAVLRLTAAFSMPHCRKTHV